MQNKEEVRNYFQSGSLSNGPITIALSYTHTNKLLTFLTLSGLHCVGRPSLGRERATKGQVEARAKEDPIEERAKDARRRARSDYLVKRDRRRIAVVLTDPRDP